MGKLAIFEGKKIRRVWDEKNEKWWFAVADVVEVLTESVNPGVYWRVLKKRLKDEGSEVVTKCNELKMRAADEKEYLTDAADTETVFRIIQTIPSPKAEPFKLWLARMGYERVEEEVGFEPTNELGCLIGTIWDRCQSAAWLPLPSGDSSGITMSISLLN